jgi:hypothetical protein
MGQLLMLQYSTMPVNQTFGFQLADITLPDVGFAACALLLIPYRGVRYHLAEWGQARIRPAN